VAEFAQSFAYGLRNHGSASGCVTLSVWAEANASPSLGAVLRTLNSYPRRSKLPPSTQFRENPRKEALERPMEGARRSLLPIDFRPCSTQIQIALIVDGRTSRSAPTRNCFNPAANMPSCMSCRRMSRELAQRLGRASQVAIPCTMKEWSGLDFCWGIWRAGKIFPSGGPWRASGRRIPPYRHLLQKPGWSSHISHLSIYGEATFTRSTKRASYAVWNPLPVVLAMAEASFSETKTGPNCIASPRRLLDASI